MSAWLWQLRGIDVAGRSRPRLRAVDLDVLDGVTAVIGPSGAGKTTLLNLLVGFERPRQGTVRRLFEPLPGQLPVYWTPPNQGLWPHLSARQHLLYVGAGAKLADAVLDATDLCDVAEALPDRLSQGQRSRLSVARALATQARVLVMDEPMAHVDPATAQRCWLAIRDLAVARGTALIFSTHLPRSVLVEAQHAICVNDGMIAFAGPVERLYWQPPSPQLALYLGESNWLTPAESQAWLNVASPEPRCYRPQQLVAEVAAQGPVVCQARFAGEVLELDLEHDRTQERRRFTTRPSPPTPHPGQRVLLRLASILLLAMLTLLAPGCGGSAGDSPLVSVRAVEHWTMPPDDIRIPAPRSVTLQPDGCAIVLDNAGRVLVFDPAGKLLRQWRMPANDWGNPEGACVAPDGSILVADTHYHRVVTFDPQGNVLSMFGEKGEGPGQFIYPVAVTLDDAGNLYVAEYGGNDRVQKFDPQRKHIATFGSFGTAPQQFQRPSGLIWRDGLLYVADAINNRIQIFSDTGEHRGTLGGPGSGLDLRFPYDISEGAGGTLWVVEYQGNRVTHLTRAGKLLGRWGSAGPGEGQVTTPWGMAADATRVIIADTGNRRLVELRL
jgi:ABC-type multidrug transport system ATPase subunit/sugar lactone lactonase YvrE